MTLKRNSKAMLDVYASQLLKKPEAQIYIQQHIDKATNTIVSLLEAEKDDIKLRAATDILDRTQGKAVQQIQSTSKVLVMSIDLTSSDDITDSSTT